MQFDGLERVMYVFSWIFSEGVVSSLFFGCCLFCGMVLLKVVWCVKIIYFRGVGWGGGGVGGDGALNFISNRCKFAVWKISEGGKAIYALDQEPKTNGDSFAQNTRK